MKIEITPLQLIDALRASDENLKYIFTQGSCYRFHLFLKTIFPKTIGCINNDEDHIISLIDGEFYDINGLVENYETFRKLDKYDLKKVKKWSFAANNMLKITECEQCEASICFDHHTPDKLISW